MQIMIGILLAAPGVLAALAGACAIRRVRRLRRSGVPTWARTVDAPASGDRESAGTPRQLVLQYPLADGRLAERLTLARAGRKAALEPGQKVLVWYDPEDPSDVLVYGRWGRGIDRALVAAGTLFVLMGGWIALFRP